MNCKPGDLAIFINPENAGRMVRVIAASHPVLMAHASNLNPGIGPSWQCEALSDVVCWMNGESWRQIVIAAGTVMHIVPDRDLRPLRGDDDSGSAERGLYKPKPQREFT